MAALNCFACARRQARSQVAADTTLLMANNEIAANIATEISRVLSISLPFQAIKAISAPGIAAPVAAGP
jgi:hypothetical protein